MAIRQLRNANIILYKNDGKSIINIFNRSISTAHTYELVILKSPRIRGSL